MAGREAEGRREGRGPVSGLKRPRRWHEPQPDEVRRFALAEARRKADIECDMDVDAGTELSWLLAQPAPDGAPHCAAPARAPESVRVWERRVKARPMASRQLIGAWQDRIL